MLAISSNVTNDLQAPHHSQSHQTNQTPPSIPTEPLSQISAPSQQQQHPASVHTVFPHSSHQTPYPFQPQQKQNDFSHNQHIIHQKVLANPPELNRFQFPPPDPNYVLSPSSKEQQRIGFQNERRLSMQLPPYPSLHSKNESYDSQTSLSTLADIASSDPRDDSGMRTTSDEELTAVLHSVEQALNKFRSLSQIFNDINYDFLTNVEISLHQPPDGAKETISLLNTYTSSNNEPMTNISLIFLKKFISNIPIPALEASIQMSDEIRLILESWLNYREREILRSNSSIAMSEGASSKSQQSRPSSQTSTPVVASKSTFMKGHNSQNPRTAFARQRRRNHNRHQSISGPPPTFAMSSIKQDRELSEPSNKKRKPSSAKFPSVPSSNSSVASNTTTTTTSTATGTPVTTNKKNDNISLIVKPPKPVTDSSITQPPPTKGVFNEDLSVKSDHKCQQCGSDDTPEWRRGPYGSRSLCNACGLFYGKLIKKFGFDEAAKIMLKRKNSGHGDDRRIPID